MLNCLHNAARRGGETSQRLLSFSVELIAPSNVKCGKAFQAAYDKARTHPNLGFVTVGGIGPLLTNNTHVATLLQRRLKDEATAARRTPLCVNLMCRGTTMRALEASLAVSQEADVSGLCVLKGVPQNNRSTEDSELEADAFQHPTAMIQFIRHRQLAADASQSLKSLVLCAGATPHLDAAHSAEDWKFVEEKIKNGADAIFAASGINLDNHVMSRWLHDACLRPLHEVAEPLATSTSGEHHRHVYAVPGALAAMSPKLLSRMSDARRWVVPEDLAGPMKVGMLPPHPNSPLDEDVWEANTARVFRRIMTEYTTKRLSEFLKRPNCCLTVPSEEEKAGCGEATMTLPLRLQVPRHFHLVAYENNIDDVLRLVDSLV
jgi:hypothetical protein